MKKNAHLHIVVETEFLYKLKIEAKRKGISVSELSRLKLSNNLQLDRIENLIRNIFFNFSKI
jgi:hypothetical protein